MREVFILVLPIKILFSFKVITRTQRSIF